MFKKIFSAFFIAVLFFACKQETKWIFSKEIKLNNIQPIGVVADKQNLWISDVKNNRILLIDLDGKIIREFSGIQRPMHFSIDNDKIYVPEFLTDTTRIIENEKIGFLPIAETPDAPSGISVQENAFAIADFYNHRIIYQENGITIIIGREGHNKGELYYPTDVEISGESIYVADAYNNRVQVFNKRGESLQVIGDNDNIHTATGITVSGKNIFVTDFENSRILVYDEVGKLLQELTDHLSKPTDVFVHQGFLYTANYARESISVYEKEQLAQQIEHIKAGSFSFNPSGLSSRIPLFCH